MTRRKIQKDRIVEYLSRMKVLADTKMPQEEKKERVDGILLAMIYELTAPLDSHLRSTVMDITSLYEQIAGY